MLVKELAAFIREREAIRVRKESGKKRPWTTSPILDKYRFCNVHREDDRVSRWLRANWYSHLGTSEDVWFAAVIARLLNLPESLYAVLPFVLPWEPGRFVKVLQDRKERGEKNFNAAYIVSTNGVAMDKVEYITYNVLNFLWAERKNMRPGKGDTLEIYHNMLMGFDGLGSFMAAQIVADLKYLPPLKNAVDWWTFAASGPGSRRGLNRVLERPIAAPWRESDWRDNLWSLLKESAIKPFGLHGQDLQNCLCEFDKYERVRNGDGVPKQIYKENNNGQ